jgi:hypothetical protein
MYRRLLTITLTLGLASGMALRLLAQTPDAGTRARLDVLLKTTSGTPGGKSLLAVALAEAQTALAQAVQAERAATDLAAMQRAAGGILHALNPTLVTSGPGAGYGVQRALSEIVAQVEATVAADTRSDVVRTTPRALAAARATQTVADALVRLAQRLRAATAAEDAAPLAQQARVLAQQVIAGPNGSSLGPRAAGAAPGGLLGVQSSLVVLIVNREGSVPSALRTREVTR